jgi:transposase InsO family protein
VGFTDIVSRKRVRWIGLYKRYGNAGIVCLKCGIARPTLRKWLRRYDQLGMDGLKAQSRRPQHSPARKLTEDYEKLILGLRRERKLGPRRIRTELTRLHKIKLSITTVYKVLQRHGVPLLDRKRTYRKGKKRYSRPIPGDRVQMDICKIAPGLYQYTAIDDCSRYKVIGLLKRRTAANSIAFLEQVVEEMPFPIQRIQTDRGREFFAYKFQELLMEWGIKFRPIKPASPHLNGKVERAQRTDLDEFYSTVDIKSPDLERLLQEWQHYYNWDRPHSSLKGKTPIDAVCERFDKMPLSEEVCDRYDISKECLQEQNYHYDLQLRKLKRSL